MLCCAGYYPDLTSHFKAHGAGLIPLSDRDAQLKRIFAAFLKINALLKWVFTSDTKCTDVSQKTRSQTEDDGKVTSELMGILRCHSPHPWKKKKTACAANINKPSFRWRVTQGVVLPPTPTHPCPCGNGYCAGAGDGFKSLTRQLLFAFSGPLWNCSR